MKKFLKGLFGIAAIGGIAAGAYYLLNGDKYSDFDDFDDFDDDDLEADSDDELQEFLDKEKSDGDDADDKNDTEDDHYVSLDLTKDKASEDDKIIGDVKEEADKVVKADSGDGEAVEEFSFSDLTDK